MYSTWTHGNECRWFNYSSLRSILLAENNEEHFNEPRILAVMPSYIRVMTTGRGGNLHSLSELEVLAAALLFPKPYRSTGRSPSVPIFPHSNA